MMYRICTLLVALSLAGCKTITVLPKTDPGGPAVNYTRNAELPQNIRPNDATISLYQDKRIVFIEERRRQGRLYTVQPKGNASEIRFTNNIESKTLDREMAEGYLLSYIFYEGGIVKYNGKAKSGRFNQDVNDEILFYTHSTGKSITSYLIGHAICEGYIASIDEVIDWPLMSKTLYQGQPLRDLLNMRAGDKHTIDEKNSHYVMGSTRHHRDMGLDTIAELLEGTNKRGRELFYNNFLTDVLANYLVFKAGGDYDKLMQKVFQEKIKIAHPVSYEKHNKTLLKSSLRSDYYGDLQTLASYSYFMTRLDFLRLAEAIMKDYQNNTCVGKYLKQTQNDAESWYVGRNNTPDAFLWINNYAQKYGGQFYFDFMGMSGRNILGTEGYNGQNILIDMDKSRIVITNSSATAWDAKALMLDVIRDGKLPE
jgi:CubicO group peptidase (beta-lactamase class C family)